MSGVLTTTIGPGEGGKKKEEKMEEGKEEGRRKMGQIQNSGLYYWKSLKLFLLS